MMYPVYSVIIDHNFDLVNQNEFICKNIQNFLKLSKLYINFNIYLNSKNNNVEKINLLKQQIKQKCNIDINIIETQEEKNNIILNNIKKDYKMIFFDSDMLLSYFFYQSLKDFFYSDLKNIALPMMHYKYVYETFHHNNKIHNIKKFIFSKDRYYQDSDEIPDWDERFYIDSKIFNKMNGKIPLCSPSPLLHNWGEYKTIICSNLENDISKICNSRYAVHKFENCTHNYNRTKI